MAGHIIYPWQWQQQLLVPYCGTVLQCSIGATARLDTHTGCSSTAPFPAASYPQQPQHWRSSLGIEPQAWQLASTSFVLHWLSQVYNSSELVPCMLATALFNSSYDDHAHARNLGDQLSTTCHVHELQADLSLQQSQ